MEQRKAARLARGADHRAAVWRCLRLGLPDRLNRWTPDRIGIMLDPPDWGFFGYLGAGKNSWAYDAFEGAIVTETKAIHTGLPTITDRGAVSVLLDLKIENELVFRVDGVETPAIRLSAGAVVIPAACLLKREQVVTLANFRRLE